MGLSLRTFSTVESACFAPVAGLRHSARPTRSPLNAFAAEVTVKVVLTLWPDATDGNRAGPAALAAQPGGTDRRNSTSAAGAPVVFTYVSVTPWLAPGAKVWRPGGWTVAEAGARVSRGTP